MSAKDILIEQHNACYDENNWFVAIKNALAGLTAEQAKWKPDGADNTIWEEVNHLIAWNEIWLRRYRGELDFFDDYVNVDTFTTGHGDWQATCEYLFKLMDEWRKVLTDITEDKLTSILHEKRPSPWYSPIAQQNIHNAYHTGQIVLLRKLQGSWDASKGVS